MVNVGLQAFMVHIIQTVIFCVFLVLMKGQTQKKSFTLEDGTSKLLLYIGIDPKDRMPEHKQNIKAIKYIKI